MVTRPARLSSSAHLWLTFTLAANQALVGKIIDEERRRERGYFPDKARHAGECSRGRRERIPYMTGRLPG